jgi:16S rRNA U516 pseudouridylate synthase RsuA-like enzyme
MQTVRQPDASRGRAANFWYEVRMRDSKKEEMRRVLVKEQHPVEKLKRIGLGPLTVEGIPRGRYRLIEQKEAERLRKFEAGGEEKKRISGIGRRDHRSHRERRGERKAPV